MSREDVEVVTEIPAGAIDTSVVSLIAQAEIDTQISTAKKYPRSLRRFMDEVKEMVTLSEDTAGDCMYALPRGGKSIEGPSARFAEVVASAWGNCRAGARVVSTDDKFVTAQGVFHDLERNVAITYEVRRRITDKQGRTFNDDMVGVTGSAACSIALRNAVLKGVPKAFWNPLYEEARNCAVGSIETLPNKRAKMLSAFGKIGVTEPMILALLEIKGVEDIGLDELAQLRGLYTAIRSGETTIEQAFDTAQSGSKVASSTLNSKLKQTPKDSPEETAEPTATLSEFAPRENEDSSKYLKRLRSAISSAASDETLSDILEAAQSYAGSEVLPEEKYSALQELAAKRLEEIEAAKANGQLV